MTHQRPDDAARLDHHAPTVNLWGPPTVGPVEGFTPYAPQKPKAWGLIDVLWGVLAIIGTAIISFPFLALLAIAKYNIEVDGIDAAEQLDAGITRVATTGPGLVIALLSTWVAFVGVPLYASYRKGHRSLAKDFGLSFKWTDLPLGFLLAATMQALMAGISWALHQTSWDLSGADNTGQVTDQVGVALVIMILGATIGAPLTEELFFRGLILRAFLRSFAKVDYAPPIPDLTDHFNDASVSSTRRKVGVVVSILLTSLFFGLLHLQPTTEGGSMSVSLGAWIVVAQTGLLGLVFAVVAVKTRRIGLTIFAHFFFNSASIALVLITAG